MSSFARPGQSPGQMYAIAIAFIIIPTVAVVLRFYAMHIKRNQYKLDDWFILPPLVITWVMAALLVISARDSYLGRHTDIDPITGQPMITHKHVLFFKIGYIIQVVQIPAFGMTKLSILFFYQRCFTGRKFKIISNTTIVVSILWMITFTTTQIFQCWPIGVTWTGPQAFRRRNPQCLDKVPMFITASAFDLLIDLVIMAIPLPLIYKLQLPLRQRIGLIAVFMVGSMSVGASLAKLMVQSILERSSWEQVKDFSYFVTPTMYWPVIEAALGITAACLPKLPALFKDEKGVRRLIRRFRGQQLSSTKSLSTNSEVTCIQSPTMSRNGTGMKTFSNGYRTVSPSGSTYSLNSEMESGLRSPAPTYMAEKADRIPIVQARLVDTRPLSRSNRYHCVISSPGGRVEGTPL